MDAAGAKVECNILEVGSQPLPQILVKVVFVSVCQQQTL